jgi:hypothetical protein
LPTAAPTLDALVVIVPVTDIVLGIDFPFGQEIGLSYMLDGMHTDAANVAKSLVKLHPADVPQEQFHPAPVPPDAARRPSRGLEKRIGQGHCRGENPWGAR